MSNELDVLRQKLRDFAAERDWDQFHSPKNLSMALIAEAAELIEHFQWLTEEQSNALPAATREKVELELADIFLYLIRIADKLDMDLPAAAHRKIEINAQKYPATLVRGQSKKYTEY
jgi:NTP pyrophosphatase (non-canonical NTP hydrolase)